MNSEGTPWHVVVPSQADSLIGTKHRYVIADELTDEEIDEVVADVMSRRRERFWNGG